MMPTIHMREKPHGTNVEVTMGDMSRVSLDVEMILRRELGSLQPSWCETS